MAAIKNMPCIACEIERERRKVERRHMPDSQCGPTEVQHLLSGNKRRGHSATIPLGSHHLGPSHLCRIRALECSRTTVRHWHMEVSHSMSATAQTMSC